MPITFQRKSDTMVRVMSAASYLTMGIAGLIYIIVKGRDCNVMLFRFHFVQAILLACASQILSWCGGAIANTVSGILGLFGPSTAGITAPIVMGVGFILQLIQWAYLIAVILGVVQSLRGKYLEIPWFAGIARSRSR